VRMLAREVCGQLPAHAAPARVNPEQMVVVVVGPAAQVQADLEKTAPLTVVRSPVDTLPLRLASTSQLCSRSFRGR